MKIRTKSVIAAAIAASFALSGCSLAAPVATTKTYDPSDGQGINVGNVKVRNMLIVAEKAGAPYNVVFTAINQTEKTEKLTLNLEAHDGKKETVSFEIKPGTNIFGDPHGKVEPKPLNLGKQVIGSTVKTYLNAGSETKNFDVPVLDGTLPEYKKYILGDSHGKTEKKDH